MFDITQLRNITLNDKAVLENFLQGLNEFSCEMSFSNLAMWHEAYKTQFAFDEKQRLILYSPVERMIYFPRGEAITPQELSELSSIFASCNMTDDQIYDIPEDYITANAGIKKYFDIEANEDNFDYLYENQRLADCSGSKLRKKRNLIKQFISANPDFQIIPLDGTTSERFFDLALKLNSELAQCDFISDENKVMKFACENFKALSLSGILLTDNNGNDTGFAIWSLLNSRTADIHFEKADHTIKGAAQFLTQQLASILASKNIKYMNREQDLGSVGIRQAKHSLDPAFLYRRIFAVRKNHGK